mmetsp:Transcript_21429/g.64072  ORF Transcript_21429/g.64072 Transcript_21429/m.64072 type:complete len:265 (+) Transcript_21429:240-1034(+)
MYGSIPETKKDAGSTSTNRINRSRYYLAAACSLLAAAAIALGPGRRVVKSLAADSAPALPPCRGALQNANGEDTYIWGQTKTCNYMTETRCESNKAKIPDGAQDTCPTCGYCEDVGAKHLDACDVSTVVKGGTSSSYSLPGDNSCLKIDPSGEVQSVAAAGADAYVELQGKLNGIITLTSTGAAVVVGSNAVVLSSRAVEVKGAGASITTGSEVGLDVKVDQGVLGATCNGVELPLPTFDYCGVCGAGGWNPPEYNGPAPGLCG